MGFLLATPLERALHVHLLGALDFDAALRLQRQLVDRTAEPGGPSALLLCEHPPLITVGRQGSTAHLLFELDDLRLRGWPVRWVNRGGGCLLHMPGQLAIYPVIPLRRYGLGLQDHLDRLHEMVLAVLDDFSVQGELRPGQAGVWVGNRQVAFIGVAVRDWVTYYGAVLNVDPDLLPFRHVRSTHAGDGPMTSLARERHGAPRMAHVRQQVVEHFTDRFRFSHTSILFSSRV